MQKIDVIIIGAGAAGLMCAIEAAKRGRKVLILDHANKVGKKILMSGGGRCNFTNYYVAPVAYLSHNIHFCKSALNRYSQWDFIELVKRHKIPFHEKNNGELFCDNKSKDIVDMLLLECDQNGVKINLNTIIERIENPANYCFNIKTLDQIYHAQALVVASGGLSIPTMGASAFGYKVAEQFNIKRWPMRAGLVPLTLQPHDKEKFSVLAGISIESLVTYKKICFSGNILFTHRGLSGPAILQVSSYWEAGENLIINLLPTINLFEYLKTASTSLPTLQINTSLSGLLPKRAVETFLSPAIATNKLTGFSHHDLSNPSYG